MTKHVIFPFVSGKFFKRFFLSLFLADLADEFVSCFQSSKDMSAKNWILADCLCSSADCLCISADCACTSTMRASSFLEMSVT